MFMGAPMSLVYNVAPPSRKLSWDSAAPIFARNVRRCNMDLTQLDFKQIFVWVMIWLVGYGLGLLESWVKKGRKKEGKPEPEVIQLPPELIEEDYALALFEEGENLILKLDKTELSSPEMLNDIQRKRLISLVVKLRPWLDGSKVKHSPKPAPVQSQVLTRPVSAPQSMPPQAAPRPAAAQGAVSQSVSVENDAARLEYEKLSMVEQIDWILQKKLENHPLKARKIRLQGALTGGVNFLIGNEEFAYRDEIPYPEIKALIEEAIAEWERKSTPGL